MIRKQISEEDFLKHLKQYNETVTPADKIKDNLLVKAGIYKKNGELSENYKD